MSSNTFATSSVANAYKVHKVIYGHLYPYPMEIHIKNHKIFIEIDNIVQMKYIPFLIAFIVITAIIGFGSCALLLTLKIFQPMPSFDAIAVIFCIFLACCSFLEIGTYITYWKTDQMETLFNQILCIERKCTFAFYNLTLIFLNFMLLLMLF